ncbi:MAG: hypothetical protein AAGD33_20405 [Actinomycetota bacterium]
MIDAFVEGGRSIVQACHLVILVPVAAMVLAARARWQVMVGAVVGIVVGGWLFATRWLVLDQAQIRWSGLLVGALAVAVVVPALPRWFEGASSLGDTAAIRTLGQPWVGASLTALVAIVVTAWWRPCVGEHLGTILSRAPDEPFAQLPAMVGFMLGISVPLVAIGLLVRVLEPGRRSLDLTSYAAAGLGVLSAVAVVAGRQADIVARLFEWSQ